MPPIAWLEPDWPAPASVRAVATMRRGGVSSGPFASLNLADHVGDDPQCVRRNRERLCAALELPTEPLWLRQVHGCTLIRAEQINGASPPEADAVIASTPDRVCAVLTADCLPVLLCDDTGTQVAAAHAGWRGLADGVLEQTVAAFAGAPERLFAWIGPAIGATAFEVGPEVRAAFLAVDAAASAAFRPSPNPTHPDRWLADLAQIARQRLARLGITQVFGGEHCTATAPERFFSYRRDGRTGRQVSLIWLAPPDNTGSPHRDG